MSYLTRGIKPYFEKATGPLVHLFTRLEVSPNTITIAGFFFVVLGSIFLYLHQHLISFFFLLIGGLADAIDGTLARKNDLKNDVGSFLDSVVDRFSDSAPFIAISLSIEDKTISFLSLLALTFSYGVSYTRAKAESLGYDLKVGLFERAERWMVLLTGILLGMVEVAIAIILMGSFITLLQRVFIFIKRVKG
ncbi:MAG: CDP-alcohol phosphatidyltransferase family protein [Aquificaceae bacterium]